MTRKLTLAALGFALALSPALATVAMADTAKPAPAAPQGGPGFHGGPNGGQAFFDRVDANHDGYITKDEMLAFQRQRTEDMFQKLDTDHDGRLSKAELDAGREAMRAKMREHMKDRPADGGAQNAPKPAPDHP